MTDYRQLQAYTVKKDENLADVGARGVLLEHKKTGARVVLMENDDENKVFSVGFRTPVSDSTGVPHILEHSVLCGSKNFPLKDPFVELVKGSLNTFLNAMTYPDKTLYPVASCNDADFQNLIHVYMDAVFYPNIYDHEEIFRQEGWSYKLDSAESELTYNGVVYNEMKGAFSSPEGVLDRMILNSLFPDTNYANESGGDPDVIPELTYEAFLDFHRTYYHPSNSYIYLYGKMDMAKKLQWLDEMYLSHFERKEVVSQIIMQKPFSDMRRIRREYSVSSTEPLEAHTFLSYNKVIGSALDEKLSLSFEILDYALLSAPGAPLKKALIESGIGQDVNGSFDNGVQQPIFSVIAKNADEDQQEEFVQVIEKTLSGIVEKGIDKKALEAGINYHEFRFREADFGSYPKGLIYGLQIYDSWIYDDEKPFLNMKALDLFAALRREIETGYFEELIRQYILDNRHGSLVTVAPCRELASKREKEIREELAAYKASLSPEEVEKLVRRTKELEKYQDSPERPEDMEKIPMLRRDQLSAEVEPAVNKEVQTGSGVPVVFHDLKTNGIGYGAVMFSLEGIDEQYMPYVGVLQSILGLIDTDHYTYGDLYNEINIHTGGIGTSLTSYFDSKTGAEKKHTSYFVFNGKSLYEQIPVVFSMIGEIILGSKLSDTKRIKEILDMLKGRLSVSFTSSGHTTAVQRGLSCIRPEAKFADDTNGVGLYEVVKELAENYDRYKDDLTNILKHLALKIFRADRMLISFTAEEEGLDRLLSCADELAGRLEKEESGLPPVLFDREKLYEKGINEGFMTSSKVQYVARCGSFIDKGLEYTGALQVLKVILSYDYLWMNLRVKGGAYGCMSGFNKKGDGYLVSYRDPHLKRTLETYEGVSGYLKTFSADDRQMDKYVIGALSNVTRPLTPSQQGERSFTLYMSKISMEELVKERKEILETSVEDIRRLHKVIDAILSDNVLCVVGAEDKIRERSELFGSLRSLFS